MFSAVCLPGKCAYNRAFPLLGYGRFLVSCWTWICDAYHIYVHIWAHQNGNRFRLIEQQRRIRCANALSNSPSSSNQNAILTPGKSTCLYPDLGTYKGPKISQPVLMIQFRADFIRIQQHLATQLPGSLFVNISLLFC